MLPKFLFGTYKRYKADTSTLVEWLVRSAKKCGYQPAIEKVVRNDRAKSKGSLRIRLKELTVLAKIVAESNAFHVPAAVIKTARSAISLRRRCAKWFSASTKDDTTANDEAHSHFIVVLEQVCDILEQKTHQQVSISESSQKANSAVKENSKSALLEGNNPFSALSLEECSEMEESQLSLPEDAEIELDEAEDDSSVSYSFMLFSLFCMFEDLNHLRQFVSQSLAEYLEGKIDLTNLAVIADTAVSLAKELIAEVTTSLPQFPEEQSLQQYVFMAACDFRGEDWHTRPDAGILYNTALSEVADFVFLPTSILLLSFRNVLVPGQAPVYKKGCIGTYDSKANRERMSTAQKFKEDQILLMELLPEFAFIATLDLELPVLDEISRGLISLMRDKKVTIWNCFGTQILLDVHHALRHAKDKAFNDLRLHALRTKKTIEEYWEFSKTFSTQKPVFWPKEAEEYIQELHACVETWVVNDALYQVKQRAFPKQIASGGHIEKHCLFKSNGILAGLMMFNFTLRLHQSGLALVNQWYDVGQLAFLYNLAQQTGMRDLQWEDMDLFIDIHGEEKIFVGGRPKTADESLKKLRLVTGISGPGDFARDSLGRTIGVSSGKHKARLLEPDIAIVKIFQDRYLNDGLSKISMDNVKELLTEMSSMKTSANELQPVKLTLQPLYNPLAGAKRLGALQLLAVMKQGLYAEEPRLRYNYFGMHKRCIEILRRIQTKEHHKFVQYFTSVYLPNDTFITTLVLLILTVAQGSAKASQELGIPTSAGKHIASRIVMSCEEVMEGYLRTEGARNCKELKTFCKNTSLIKARQVELLPRANGYSTSLGELLDPACLAALQTGIRMA